MTAQPTPTHPVIACVEDMERSLRSVADVPVAYLRTGEKATALIGLARVEAEVADLKLRILAEAGDVAEEAGARDAGAWLAHTTRVDYRAAHGDWKLAEALDTKYAVVAAGMRTGTVNAAQARVIVHALDKLPTDLDELTRARAERHLVELAAVHGPRELRILGARILDVVAPDIAETELGKALEREGQHALENCWVRLRPCGDGTTRISARVPDAIASRLVTYLDALDSPRVAKHRQRGQAFCALLENLDPTNLPDHGGDATVVTVTISLESLMNQLGSATLDDNTMISATEARRLACTAKILPAVLGGKGEVLDLGRARRLFSPAQRKAMRIRDKRCRAEGCTTPARWSEVHHLTPWSKGGNTDLGDGVHFCTHDHHRAHDPRFSMTKLPNGDYRFHRRT